MKRTLSSLLLGASLGIGLASQACSAVDNAVDCHAICKRYADCFNSAYDVAACESRCKSNAANDRDYAHKVDVCSACIDDQSCTSATFNCGSSCSSVVP